MSSKFFLTFNNSLIIIVLLITPLVSLSSQESPLEKNNPAGISGNWVATDALGRKLPGYEEVGALRQDKYVGIFYWTWHIRGAITREPVSVESIISEYPEAINDFTHPLWTRKGGHHWSEPLFGYYVSTDQWVLRKHAEMLADAGVDAVFFDCTNGDITWVKAYEALMKTWDQAQKDGVNVPKIVFMLPLFGQTEPTQNSLRQLYRDVYKPGRYQNLWFYWDGKPCIMGYPDVLTDSKIDREIADFFTFRPGQPEYLGGPQRDDDWGWLEMYPQNGYVEYAPGEYEQVPVGVAQNATDSLTPAAMNDTLQVYGRSYTQRFGMNSRPEAVNCGLNFQEQWKRALEIDPKMVFVTGWNEWIAGRYEEWQGTPNAFPDQFCQEYSRDIEPMKGGHGDNYYYQLVSNIRRFKGVNAPPEVSDPITIKIDGKFSKWKDVKPEFSDHLAGNYPRNHRGYGSTWYENYTLRNDIVRSKVARDANNLYFYVETAEDISAPDEKWMMLLINIDRNQKTGWEGYDFVVNRQAPNDNKGIIEKCVGRWKWNEIGHVDFIVRENYMELKIPKTLLVHEKVVNSIEFKWSDNMQDDGNIMDFYINGDAAPSGRFNYIYPAF